MAKTIIINFWFFIYDILFLVGFLLYLPIYWYRGKITWRALKEKMGFFPDGRAKGCIWIQAVSVGEVNLLGGLLKRLEEAGQSNIVVSTTTLSGNRLAVKKYSSKAKIIFLPLDISFVINRVLKALRPKVFVALETEIWPHLFFCLERKGVPIVIINGRISDKAYKRYRRFPFIAKYSLAKCRRICVQNSLYKERFASLGAHQDKITICGNMKFESIEVDESHLNSFRQKFAPLIKKGEAVLILAASTHCPEEEYILRAYMQILDAYDNAVLIIAPRHIERTAEIEMYINSHGFNPLRASKLGPHTPLKNSVLIFDILGELLYLYSLADICFVGGSLVDRGGQNILEPLYFSKPVVFGPYMSNFSDVAQAALKNKAAVQIKSSHELKNILARLLDNKDLRSELSNNCLNVFNEQKGAYDVSVKGIIEAINNKASS